MVTKKVFFKIIILIIIDNFKIDNRIIMCFINTREVDYST